MGILDALHVGQRGLAAASIGIGVTSDNVTNVNTEGYSRKSVSQVTSDPVSRGGLFLGQGASVTGILRASDRILGSRLVAGEGVAAEAQARYDTLRLAEAELGEGASDGLHAACAAFFDALSSATSDPSSASLRRAIVASADTLASTLVRDSEALDAAIDGVGDKLDDELGTVNSALVEIALLNEKVMAAGGDLAAGSLVDRRDQLLRDMGAALGATAEIRADGQATLFLGGHAIVQGGEARELSLVEDADGLEQVYVSIEGASLDVGDALGGTWGGWMTARATLDDLQDQLDTFAFTFGTAINAQHAAGFDASGAAGGDVFELPAAASGAAGSIAVDDLLADDPDRLALGGDATAAAGDGANLAALIALETDASVLGSTPGAFLRDALGELGTAVGIAAAESEAAEAIVFDLDQARASISGVDTDEEAMQLLSYQAAYRAAARVISAADELIQSLIAIGS
jgi:flagellar hook-associated protein 1 FlgK